MIYIASKIDLLVFNFNRIQKIMNKKEKPDNINCPAF